MNGNFSKNRLFLGLFVSLLAIAGIWVYRSGQSSSPAPVPEISFSSGGKSTPVQLMDFNPNDLNLRQWQQLGFSEKQAQTILNYKKSLGGEFRSRQEFSRCYAVSPQKYAELQPYIMLPEGDVAKTSPNSSFATFPGRSAPVRKSISVHAAFDPNEVSAAGWQQMGFTPKQAEVILKYKKMLGGRFSSAQQLADCFVISPEAFAAMQPYLRITAPAAAVSSTPAAKPARQLVPFDPNALTKEGWMALGYSERQAQSILNYKEKYLRGAFRTPEDVEKNFILNDRYAELKPYLRLSASTATPASSTVTTPRPAAPAPTDAPLDLKGLDLNALTKEQLQQSGISAYLAAGIVNYRKQLGGFADKKQVYEVYNIDRETAENLIEKTRLSSNIEKYTLLNAPEGWLKTHPYFRYHADKIIFYRTSYPDEKKIWKLLKARPDQEAKMRMYLL